MSISRNENAVAVARSILATRGDGCDCEQCVIAHAVIGLYEENARLRKTMRQAAELMRLNGLCATAGALDVSLEDAK